MTVNELKEYLEQFDGDMEVKFSYNFGDYWKTQVAEDISDVEEGYVKYSDYHRMDKIDEDEDEDSERVVLLS
jgi:hypothetical protein